MKEFQIYINCIPDMYTALHKSWACVGLLCCSALPHDRQSLARTQELN